MELETKALDGDPGFPPHRAKALDGDPGSGNDNKRAKAWNIDSRI